MHRISQFVPTLLPVPALSLFALAAGDAEKSKGSSTSIALAMSPIRRRTKFFLTLADFDT
jgi:hypothetical protein